MKTPIMNRGYFENKTVSQLKEMGKEKGLKFSSKQKKEEIVDMLYSGQEGILSMKELSKETETCSTDKASTSENEEKKPKSHYIDGLKEGMLIAFSIGKGRALSAKVSEIHKKEVVVFTKNGVTFTVKKEDIIWVKTGTRWPTGVFNALKGLGLEDGNE